MQTICGQLIFLVATILALLLAPFSQLRASAPGRTISWQAINSKNRPNCSVKKPCRVFQDGLTYDFIFYTKLEGKKLVFEKLGIKNNAKGINQEFVLDAMRDLSDDEYFEIFKVNLRPGKFLDVALAAFSSPREGRVYYYFLFDQKTRSFVMSEGTYPKLILSRDGSSLESELQGTPFVINDDLKITHVNK